MSDEPEDELCAAAYRIVRRGALRVLATAAGRAPIDYSDEEAAAALEPHDGGILYDAECLEEIIKEARRQGTETAHNAFHELTVKKYPDHEILDQAIEATIEREKE